MGILPNPIIAFTQQDLLDLFERILPEHYLAPLKAPGPGYEVLQAFAQAFARISSAVENLGADAQIATAASGGVATGTVELYRDAPAVYGLPVTGQSGNTASIVAGAAPNHARVSGLSGMSVASVGHFLVLSNVAELANSGGFEITGFVSATTVDIYNPAAVIPDSNNGTISWQEESRVVTVKAGTIVTTSSGGRDFATTEDVTFQPNDLGPFSVPIRAVTWGYAWNVPGQVIAADGEVLPGDIDTMKTLVESPEMLDTTIQVRQIVSTTGGRDASLDAIGGDRGIDRLAGEADDSYRSRVRQLPDTISPDALARAISSILRPYNASFSGIETFEIGYQTCYDGPAVSIPTSGYDTNLFCFDDPRNPIPFRNRWLDLNDCRGGIIVVVDNLEPIQDTSLVLEDLPAADYLPVAGQSGFSASIVAGAAYGWMRVTGLSGMTGASVGHFLTISGAASPSNNGSFLIVQVNSGVSVDVVNETAVVPDVNNPNLSWVESTRQVHFPDAISILSLNTGGTRACNAYDVPVTLNFGYLQGGYDGTDLLKQAVYKGISDTLQSIKPAGVSVAIELKGQ